MQFLGVAAVTADEEEAAVRLAGMAFPAGATVKVVENTGTHLHFVLPPKPVGQLSDEALDEVAGGAGPIPGKTGFWSGGASYG